jgi:hypothetical protein
VRALITVAATTFALAGCGGSDSSGDGGIPSELVGTYRTTLQASDLPDPPPVELTGGGLRWKLTVATSGGPGDVPVLMIDSERAGNLEATELRVDGDRLILPREECAAGGTMTFYENEYRWKLDGTTLTLTPVVNRCPDEVALTVLTSRPWTKTA